MSLNDLNQRHGGGGVTQAEFDALKQYVTDMSPVVTVTAPVVSVSDAAPLDAEGLVVDIEPVQDLHGYDHPWPAGGGACVLRQYEEAPSIPGLTISVNNGRITISGTVSQTTTIDAPVTHWQWDGVSDYWLSGCPAGGSVYEGYSLRVDDGVSWSGFDVGNGVGLSGVTPGKDLFFRVVLRAGTYSDLTFAPMLNAGLSAAPYSPYSNICPISGWTGANVTRTGVNVWDEEWELGGFNTSTGQPAPDTDRIRSKNAISVSPNTKYRFVGGAFVVLWYTVDDTYIDYSTPDPSNNERTSPSTAAKLRFAMSSAYGTTYNNNISINYPSTDTSYHPYVGTTYHITFPTEAGTVYGGALDVTTGLLTVDRAMINIGDAAWVKSSTTTFVGGNVFTKSITSLDPPMAPRSRYTENTMLSDQLKTGDSNLWSIVDMADYEMFSNTTNIFISASDYDDANDFRAAMFGVQLVYELATPITYQLTPQQVTLLRGNNTIFADTGDSTLTYRQDALQTQQTEYERIQDSIAIIVDGDSAAATVESGMYAYIKNNTHNLPDGLYVNTNTAAFPTGGGTAATSTYFTAVGGGGLNAMATGLMDKADAIVDTAAGAMAWFPDGAAVAAKDITIGIEPVQSGSGDPGPDNVRPISGWTGANIRHAGKQLMDWAHPFNLGSLYYNPAIGSTIQPGTNPAASISVNGNVITCNTTGGWRGITWRSLDLPHGVYHLSFIHTKTNWPSTSDGLDVFTVDRDNAVCRIIEHSATMTSRSINITLSGDEAAIVLCMGGRSGAYGTFTLTDYCLETGSAATAFEAYEASTIPIDWTDEAGTVYGGALDVTTGLLTVTQGHIASYDGETLPGKWISSMDVYSPGGTPTTGAQVVYELAAPVTYALAPTEVVMLPGTNNVWADTGDTSVTYRADTKRYIEKINAPTDDDMTADAQIASGKYFIIGGSLYKATTTIPAGDAITPGTNCILTNLAEALNALNA